MVLNQEQPTLLGYIERKQETLLVPTTAPTPAPATISPQAQAIIDKVDRASQMLARATHDYERLYVRDQAQAALVAARVLKLDDIVKQASVMVQRAERAIAKANPAPSPAEAGARKGLDPKSNPVPAVAATTVQKMRQAHAGITDEQFDAKVKQTLTDPMAPPLTRSALLKESREQRRNEQQEQQQAADAERRKQATNTMPPQGVELLNLSIADLFKRINSQTIDVIFTEPPYGEEHLWLYSDLAYFALKALKPGGLLLTLSGSQHLPEIYRRLDAQNGMNYRHHFVYNAPSANATLKDTKIHAKQQPLICYSNGDYAGEWQDDLIASPEPKPQHAAAIRLALSKFATAGMTVCDPFMGQGATGVAAMALGCAFIGNDIDEDCVADAKQRIAAAADAKARQDAENPWLPGIA